MRILRGLIHLGFLENNHMARTQNLADRRFSSNRSCSVSLILRWRTLWPPSMDKIELGSPLPWLTHLSLINSAKKLTRFNFIHLSDLDHNSVEQIQKLKAQARPVQRSIKTWAWQTRCQILLARRSRQAILRHRSNSKTCQQLKASWRTDKTLQSVWQPLPASKPTRRMATRAQSEDWIHQVQTSLPRKWPSSRQNWMLNNSSWTRWCKRKWVVWPQALLAAKIETRWWKVICKAKTRAWLVRWGVSVVWATSWVWLQSRMMQFRTTTQSAKHWIRKIKQPTQPS